MISTRTHGILDYIIGALLVAAPWLLGFSQGGAETWIPVILGLGAILSALITDFEVSAVRLMPMSAHLMGDVVGGLFLAISPWLFGFAAIVWVPHVLAGLLVMGSGLMTRHVPRDTGTRHDHHIGRHVHR